MGEIVPLHPPKLVKSEIGVDVLGAGAIVITGYTTDPIDPTILSPLAWGPAGVQAMIDAAHGIEPGGYLMTLPIPLAAAEGFLMKLQAVVVELKTRQQEAGIPT